MATPKNSETIGRTSYDEPLEPAGLAGANAGGDAQESEAHGDTQPSPGDDPHPEALVLPTSHETMLARARKALQASKPQDGQHDLNLVISARTADLPWLLALENRSDSPVELAALPSLIRFEVQPPPQAEPQPDDAPGWKKKEPERVHCSVEAPSSLSLAERVLLEPGQFLAYEFDPRPLCDDPSVLREGATIVPEYGFPLDTKRLWRQGKLQNVLEKQEAPFVASWALEEQLPPSAAQGEGEGEGEGEPSEDPDDPQAVAALTPAGKAKTIRAPEFILDETYPLAGFEPWASSENGGEPSNATPDSGEKGAAGAETGLGPTPAQPPPPPLTLEVLPMGSTNDADEDTVTVRVKNTSGETMKLFLRRELITFELIGPSGLRSCRMSASQRAPDKSNFSTLSPGSTRTLQTRLAEACPAGTFDQPGVYSVSARLEATHSGAQHDLDAFVGTAVTEKPASFVIRGTHHPRRAPMLVSAMVVPAGPPATAGAKTPARNSAGADVGGLTPTRTGPANDRAEAPDDNAVELEADVGGE